MTDEPVAPSPAEEFDAQASPMPPAAIEPEPAAGPPVATASSEAPAMSPRRADRAQQILTAAVLLLIVASAVLLTISIANQ